jgi:hypothetical protein
MEVLGAAALVSSSVRVELALPPAPLVPVPPLV